LYHRPDESSVIALILQDFQLKNFRNYPDQTLVWTPGINLVYGQNAQGKTNLLEGVLYLLTGHSHRAATETEMISYGMTDYYLQGKIAGQTRCHRLETGRQNGEKFLRVNSLPEKSRACLLGEVGAVIFAPEDLNLIKAGPAERRHFINALASQLWPRYYSMLVAYRRVLTQRNALLKQIREGCSRGETLPELNRQFAALASEIVAFRRRTVAGLALFFGRNHQEIAGSGETVELSYLPVVVSPQETSPEAYLAALEKCRRAEIARGVTLVGPHRDDLGIVINSKGARQFASQGQQRTAVLSLKLAELAMLAEALGETPVFLLDDVMSELDARRREYLLHLLGDNVQTIMTGTETGVFGKLQPSWGVYQITGGHVDQQS
jgi:DNA replication and repair protein RecF